MNLSFDRLLDRFGKKSDARRKNEDEEDLELPFDDEQEDEEPPELSLYAVPEKGTKFNRKFIIYSAIGIAVVFMAAFAYGVSTSGTAMKKQATEVKEAVQGEHLNNVPKGYDDSKNKNFQQAEVKKDKAPPPPVTQPAPAAPASYYTPEPTPPPRYTPIPQPQVAQQPVQVQPQQSAQEKIAQQRAKEKLDANKSPIRFKFENSEGEKKAQ